MKTTTSISDLKARLSAYLDLVRHGEEVLVTDRGRPIARLAPVTGDSAAEGRRESLLRSGRMMAPRGPLPSDFLQRPRPADPSGDSLAALLEERGSIG
ncbi:MAG TPA: type II toxin-antitoxin system prevent-host-death family antitoxin [Phycisphaerales bacterium]|nr:type II toxin-antitoxin system prevent-host-death family antitoxin [Phycisphaerales bacterium]HMP36331.1 type II toxin-antitoxin system prevent-host-death family antitoxin [Phycisphaerales bacterium]